MNKVILTIATIALCAMAAESYAQDKKAKKEAHIKIMTEHDGKKTNIDTVINLNDLEGNIHEVLKNLNLDDELKSVSEALKNVDIDIDVNGEKIEMEGLEDAMIWVGEALEDMDFDINIDEDGDNVWISSEASSGGTKSKTVMKIKTDENGYSYETIEGDEAIVDVDLDGGSGNIFIKSKDGSGENVMVFIDEDGKVEVENFGEGGDDKQIKTKVKMIELGEDGEARIIQDGDDEVDVKVFTDKDGNMETKVIVKTISMKKKAADIDAPALPGGLDLQVYPNPNNGHFVTSFRNSKKSKTTVRVFDTKGNEVYSKDLGKKAGVNSENMDLEHLRPGTYIMKIEQGKNSTSSQFVIQQ